MREPFFKKSSQNCLKRATIHKFNKTNTVSRPLTTKKHLPIRHNDVFT